jgi:hypothetical protein
MERLFAVRPPMNRPCLERSQSPTSVFGVLIVVAATAMLANPATCTAALAQQRVPIAQQRDAIWHVQPRIQDLPPVVAQEEGKTQTELDDIAKKLEMIEQRICRGC